MKVKLKTFAILLPLLLASAMVSCSSDDDDTTKLYMSGTLALSHVPYYMQAGETLTVRPSGVIHPLGHNVGYYYQVNYTSSSTSIVKDTVKYATCSKPYPDSSFSFTFPDTLANFTITCYAYPNDEEYYSTSISSTVATVDSLQSIPALNFKSIEFHEVDPRDSRDIFYVKIGGRSWMRKNLVYHKMGKPFFECECMRPVFGSFYTWEEACKACPAGWHLPSDQEWADMANAVGGSTSFKPGEDFYGVAGALMLPTESRFNVTGELWEFWPDVKITNSTGFCAIPAGYSNNMGGEYDFVGYTEYACFWTSTASADNSDRAYYRYIYEKEDVLKAGLADKTSFGASVRCIKD